MVVDDHAEVRRGVIAVLRTTPDISVCAEAGGVAEAVELARATRPEVVLVDVRLRDGSGIEASRDIGACCPSASVVLLTSMSEDEARFAAVLSGARGYLLKQLLGVDLLSTVRAVARGERLLPVPPLDDFASVHLDPGTDVLPDQRVMLALVLEGRTDHEIAFALSVELSTARREVAELIVLLQDARAQGASKSATPPRSHPVLDSSQQILERPLP